jgi:excisionase family DNA binding protein
MTAKTDAAAGVLRGLLEDQLGADFLNKPFASVRETAEVLGMPPSTLYDAIARGDVPSLRIGGRIYVAPAQLARLVLGETA